jgi:hypothetical protein
MKNQILKLMLVVTVIISIISCTKEGPQGPKGDTGAAGTNGTNGTNGNANVQYTDWLNCNITNEFSSGGYYYKRYNFLGDQNSSDSTAAILKYMRIIFNNGVITTGYQVPFEYTNITYTSWYAGEFIAKMPTSTSDAGINRYQIRVVILKGNVHLRLRKPLNQMSYNEICNMYHIPE